MAIAVIGAVAAVVGAAVSAYSAIEAGQQAEATGRFNQRMARNQALLAQQAADVAAAQERERTRRTQGAAAALIGASGVQPEGSPLLSMISNAQSSELNARLIQSSAQRAVFADIAAGNIASFEGRQQATAGYYRAASYAPTILTGATSLYRAATTPSSAPTGEV